jgi:hypothetical protein
MVCGRGRGLVVKQHPYRRGIIIVILTRFNGPEEGHEKTSGHQNTKDYQDDKYTHNLERLPAKSRGVTFL